MCALRRCLCMRSGFMRACFPSSMLGIEGSFHVLGERIKYIISFVQILLRRTSSSYHFYLRDKKWCLRSFGSSPLGPHQQNGITRSNTNTTADAVTDIQIVYRIDVINLRFRKLHWSGESKTSTSAVVYELISVLLAHTLLERSTQS